MNPRVENTLADDGSGLPVTLAFRSMDEFCPASIARQVEPLWELLEIRHKIRNLLAEVNRSADLEGLLHQVLQNSDDLGQPPRFLGAPRAGGPALVIALRAILPGQAGHRTWPNACLNAQKLELYAGAPPPAVFRLSSCSFSQRARRTQ